MSTNFSAKSDGVFTMSEHAIEFLQEWIDEKCQCPATPVRIEEHAETLARECAAKAAEVGIALEDIQEEVGDIQDLIASRLEDAVEAANDEREDPPGTKRSA
jgi:hypothetical protein